MVKDLLPEWFLKLSNNKKVLIIVGPTASGKTDLGLKLAEKFNGEIISADSRQIYKGMDIGTGKDVPVNSKFEIRNSKLKLWGLDLIWPNEMFSVSQWLDYVKIIIKAIWQKNKLPIIVGGTGFWIKALVKGLEWGRVKPNKNLRQKLEAKKLKQLKTILKTYDKKYYFNLSKSDWQNKRRLVRRIEIAKYIKTNPGVGIDIKGIDKNIKVLTICLKTPKKVLKKRIEKRIEKRLEQGLLKEIRVLLSSGFSFDDFGLKSTLGYKEFRLFFETGASDKELLKEAIREWTSNEWHYAKRQMVWFKKNLKDAILIKHEENK